MSDVREMKIIHLAIIAILSVVIFSSSLAYAEQPLLDFYNNSHLVLVGKIISLSQVPTTSNPSQSPYQTRYDVQVEQYYKNPQVAKLIIVYGYAKGIYFGQDPTFNVGDRVFLYLDQENGYYQIQPHSFALNNDCDARPMVPMPTLPFEPPPLSTPAHGRVFEFQSAEGTRSDTFGLGDKIHINFIAENDLPVIKYATLNFTIKKENNTKLIFNDTKQVTIPACNGNIPVSWDFVPKTSGTYLVNVSTSGSLSLGKQTVLFTETSMGGSFDVRRNTSGISLEKALYLPSPLTQFKSGAPASNVKCNDGLQLIIKAEDGSPACVSPGTAQKLVERGWAKNPIDELMLRYTDQTQANQIFYDIMNEKHVLDWSQTGWKYNSYDFASNSAKQTDSATIHLYLPFNETNHPECKNGSQAFVVVNLRPKSIEIESNMTEVGCIPDFNGGGDPQLNKNNQTPSALGLLLSNSTSVKPTQTVLNGTKAVDACNYFGFPCPQNPSFIAQKFDSGIYVAKAEMNGRDYYMLLGGPDKCIYPGIDGHVSCSNPADIAILKLAGANIVNVSEDIDVENHTLTLGDLKYGIASFESNRTVRLDGVTFVYKGNGSAIRGDCYGTWVNQTEGRSFSIYGGNEFDYNAFQCWPPLQYPTQIEENGKILDISPLLYSISFFDINQTVGIAWCSSDTCSMGDGFYLVKQGWNTPTIYDSPSVLKFYLQTNASTIHVGQTVGLYIGDNNTQPRQVKLPFPWYFGFHGSSLFPCDYESTTIAVFHGYLTQENLNNTEPLYLYQPGLYSCPAPYAGKTWTFQALSNVATLQCDIGEYCNDTRTMSQYIPLNGYWDSSDHFHLFEKGNYTIAGGDQWGHVEILHFSVAK